MNIQHIRITFRYYTSFVLFKVSRHKEEEEEEKNYTGKQMCKHRSK